MPVTIVIGPPTAGKTTWVLAHARPGDIVIDYDRLAEALTAPGADSHDHGAHLHGVAFKARAAAVREALRIAHEATIYIIHTNPPEADMRAYEQAGARMVVLDPGRDVILDRIREQRPHAMRSVAEQWYRSPHAQHAAHVPTSQGSRAW